jgi:ABC-type dipeptide/oligopeptide/nickel transport system permease component
MRLQATPKSQKLREPATVRTDWLCILQHFLRRLVALAVMVLAGGILCASLVRFSPGFGIDERELDSRLNSASIAAIRNSHSANRSLPKFYAQYIHNMLRGEFGTSETFQRPISELMRERSNVSLRSLAWALPGAWILVLSGAILVTAVRNRSLDVFSSIVVGGLMATPAAMVALWAASTGRGTGIALILILVPALYRYTRNILERSFRKMHVMAARARGIRTFPLVVWHVLPTAASQIIGLVAVSISMAFGALIPVEFICDSPGIGQLALQAALGRDLPLLVTLTMAVTVVTFVANTAADAVNDVMTPVSA